MVDRINTLQNDNLITIRDIASTFNIRASDAANCIKFQRMNMRRPTQMWLVR